MYTLTPENRSILLAHIIENIIEKMAILKVINAKISFARNTVLMIFFQYQTHPKNFDHKLIFVAL